MKAQDKVENKSNQKSYEMDELVVLQVHWMCPMRTEAIHQMWPIH
jgi:hypothetical protein